LAAAITLLAPSNVSDFFLDGRRIDELIASNNPNINSSKQFLQSLHVVSFFLRKGSPWPG